MKVTNSGNTPKPAAAPRSTAPVSDTDQARVTKPVPAATVEISSAARHAASAGRGGASGPRPLNIIWGDRSNGGHPFGE